jgi:adenylosuccinate synthase
MPVSVVVGGQYGSEGKGKVALEIARRERAAAVVRVGGTNSGHTAVDDKGCTWALRQLPVSMLASGTVAVLPAGALIDPEIFIDEVARLGVGPDRVYVDRSATLITATDREVELSDGRVDRIGSTASGTGAALERRLRRQPSLPMLAEDHGPLEPYLKDTDAFLASLLRRGERVVIEGTQGFGLSLLRGEYPKATGRDTSAGTFVGEAGVSPRDVDDVTLVIRSYPIRVAGNSGRLPGETTWEAVAREAGLPEGYVELTTATRRVRRVGKFDPRVVRRAIAVNNPSRIVLNHLDYVDPSVRNGQFTRVAINFIEQVEASLGRGVDWLGTDPATVYERRVLSRATNSKC